MSGRRFVLMGVSGCGKTTVGEALAARLGLTFMDGDTLHSAANVAKMTSGVPLTDADRWPWLADVGRALASASAAGTVAIGCSALRRIYRDRIREEAGGPVYFLHLAASRAVLAARVADRPGHFMPAALLDSQFATLEPLEPDETGRVIDISQPFAAVVDAAAAAIEEKAG